jgi:hypothetical protein
MYTHLWFCFKISNSEGPARGKGAEGRDGIEVMADYDILSLFPHVIIAVGLVADIMVAARRRNLMCNTEGVKLRNREL